MSMHEFVLCRGGMAEGDIGGETDESVGEWLCGIEIVVHVWINGFG